MSSTRTAKDDSAFHQSCYASSPEFERGLVANMVAKRCTVLDAKADRELIWFVQYLSHQPGGLEGVAADLLKIFSHRLGTPAMVRIGNQKNYSAVEVAEIRQEIPHEMILNFPLRGETDSQIIARSEPDSNRHLRKSPASLRARRDWYWEALRRSDMIEEGRQSELDAADAKALEEAQKHPISYPVETFRDLCRQAAEGVVVCKDDLSPLAEELRDLCLMPLHDLNDHPAWYFNDLVNVLREYHQQWIVEKSKVVVTTLGKKVCDALDYCAASHSLVLLEGNARLGKSFSARAWCDQHSGKARFVEVPPGNDDASFFRALARGLRLGSFLNYKVVEIRARVESVLLTGDVLLVLDEAQRLWPQMNLRYGWPKRIEHIMSWANKTPEHPAVPMCLILTPQFIQSQIAIGKTGWNSAPLTGRIGHYEFLPKELTLADLTAVGRAVLPEASEEILKVLASYARMSARYLAAVDSIAKRAQFIAQRNGRTQCTASDVRTAMQESVIPSDTMLIRTLERAKKSAGKGRMVAPMLPQNEIEPPAPARGPRLVPDAAPAFDRRADPVELIHD
jgi:hypothetical protein